MAEEDDKRPIIIKKINKADGHHGGAWKVAYADFVTAMMAFFLLLWLLNVTTDEEKNAISNYFDPSHPKVSQSESGAGGVLGGLTMSPQGAMASQANPITPPAPVNLQLSNRKLSTEQPDGQKEVRSKKEQIIEQIKEQKRQQEQKEFEKTKQQILEKMQSSEELQKLSKHLRIDMTPEGLRIQVIDRDGAPMFPSGSSFMYQKTQDLIAMITEVIKTLPNEISIRGHTDSVPYTSRQNYSNWELSTDRANSSRRVILDNNFPYEQVNNVVGMADTQLFLPDDPTNPQNRRISVILLKEELTNPAAYSNDTIETEMEDSDLLRQEIEGRNTDATNQDAEDGGNASMDTEGPPGVPIGTFKRTPGKVQFP